MFTWKSTTSSLALVMCLTLFSCGGSSKPQADYSLAANPGSIVLTAGGAAAQMSVSAIATNGFNETVNLTLSGAPSGVAVQPSTLSLTPGVAQKVSLMASASASADSGTVTLSSTSGALSDSVTVPITVVAAPADYSLTISPVALTITSGGTGSEVSLTAIASSTFSSPVAVAIGGLPTGVTADPATLTLSPGTAQSVTLSAILSAPAASAVSVTFTGVSGNLNHTAALALTVQPAQMTFAPDVTTYHYDVSRDGLNAQEMILSPAVVKSAQFGKVGFDMADGKVDGQPLYLADVAINGHLHNVLYVVSEGDTVYAFDADNETQLWSTSVLGVGETTSDDHSCPQITPQIGITSTPVIDRSHGPNGTIFVVGMTKDASGTYHQRLHALDVTTGEEATGSPTEVAATFPGTGDNSQNGTVVFDPSQYAERAALLLLNGNIYTTWTSHCDIGLYTGWIIGYSESTLQQTQVLNVTPNGHEGSIWMAGNGPAADSNGNIYLLDANGTFDTSFDSKGLPAQGDYGNAMLKLSTSGDKLAVADFFETYNTNEESADDLDLGSGGEMLLPDQTDSNGVVRHLIIGAGKDMNIYLADRDDLGGFNLASAPMDSNIYQEVTGQLASLVFSTPAYFNGVVYYGAINDTLKAFPLSKARLATTPTSHSSITFPYPGTTPSISANATKNGIVWALESSLTNPAVLHAYDPADLSHELYNSNQAPNSRDAFGNGNKFITPMIVNGRVYVGTQNGVAVFGLLQ